MLCVEDQIDALKWAEALGGLPALIDRCTRNFTIVKDWVERTGWVDFLATEPATRSTTSVCLKIVDPHVTRLPQAEQAAIAAAIAKLLDSERVAHDIGSYRDAPPGLRIWCGATIEESDVTALLPWLNWAFATVMATQQQTA
jgi:phosphoserine aminotransferase